MPFRVADLQRFWKVVDKTTTDCWIWFGHRTKAGYGVISFSNRQQYAHRLSYRIHKGVIPDKLFVCHSCDNPSCINPEHLFLGTQVDNMQDMASKGRHYSKTKPELVPRGDRNGSRTKPHMRPRGERHGLVKHPERAARGTNNGKYTRPEKVQKGEDVSNSKLKNHEVLEIRKLYALGGISQRKLGSMFGVAQGVICGIVNRTSWKHI